METVPLVERRAFRRRPADRVEMDETVYVIGGTGSELDDLNIEQLQASELRVLLMNPYCEAMKQHLYRIARHPRAAAEQIHLQFLLALSALRRWAADCGFSLQVRLYDDLPSRRLGTLWPESSSELGESVWCPAYCGGHSQVVEAAWADPTNAENHFDTHQIVQHDSTGRLMRRISVSEPPRLPYFDDDGALVISI